MDYTDEVIYWLLYDLKLERVKEHLRRVKLGTDSNIEPPDSGVEGMVSSYNELIGNKV